MSRPLASIGPALRALREDRDLRQNVLAERAGIGKSMLSTFENGKRRPSLASLDRILSALGADLGDLARAVERVERQ